MKGIYTAQLSFKIITKKKCIHSQQNKCNNQNIKPLSICSKLNVRQKSFRKFNLKTDENVRSKIVGVR